LEASTAVRISAVICSLRDSTANGPNERRSSEASATTQRSPMNWLISRAASWARAPGVGSVPQGNRQRNIVRAKVPVMRTITGLDELKQAEGEELGVSDWHRITQADIDAFADVTGDHQWIHVDPERAKDTPFGGTIAHGYFTLSLAPRFNEQILKMDGFAMAINYGLNKVRFPAPVPVDSQVRMRARLAELSEIAGGAQMIMELTFEREGGDKPVCVAESVVRVYTG
jgi:acyl dehydratase